MISRFFKNIIIIEHSRISHIYIPVQAKKRKYSKFKLYIRIGIPESRILIIKNVELSALFEPCLHLKLVFLNGMCVRVLHCRTNNLLRINKFKN